jgi:hypothetical protein
MKSQQVICSLSLKFKNIYQYENYGKKTAHEQIENRNAY